MRKGAALVYLALCAATAGGQQAMVTMSQKCTGMTALGLAHTQVLSAQVIPAGAFTTPPPVDPTFAQLPVFCRVVALSTPTTDSQIRIEVWLPLTGWNGRLLGRGNGGFAGSFDYSAMAQALLYGYATVDTDTGHTSGSATDASWALGHPEKINDFGYRAVHEMTVTAKSVNQAFYGKGPARAYFASCSDGGREGLIEAQRYPLDYDGILAGDPALNWTHLLVSGASDMQALLGQAGSYIAASKLPALSAAVLAACNPGDGTAILNDPRQCRFNPQTMLCAGAETDQCLTQPEITALEAVYAGARSSTGSVVFPGLLPGGELGSDGWSAWVTGPAPGQSVMANYVNNYFAYMVYQNPAWSFKTFTVDQGLRDAVAKTGAALDATNPNLAAFNARAGKLIMYHGYDDPGITPMSTMGYYNAVAITMGQATTNTFVRLFMVPGMHHCGGGPGPTGFGEGGPGPNTAQYDAGHSIYKALETWVELGIAPQQVITTGTVMEYGSPVNISRPLCAYPLVAKYTGSGDRNSASSYRCATE